jgi:alpha-mannosidase
MLEKARRLRSLEGSPRVTVEKPSAFFAAAEEEYGSQAPVWSGELYLELHRATYTTQAKTKQGNRRSDLLHQFHDILPGSSIAWVHREARATYEGVLAELEDLTAQAVRALGPSEGPTVLNASPYQRTEVVGDGLVTCRDSGAHR